MVFFATGLLLAALILVIAEMFRYLPHREEAEFGATAVACVAYLNAISFLSSFSIGWALSILNVALGLTLIMVSKHYRCQLLFVTLVSLLLALSLQGHFFPAFYLLTGLLAVTAISAMVQALRALHRQERQAFSSACIVMVACLSGVSLIISSHFRLFATGLAFLTAGISVPTGLFAIQYRLSFLIVGSFSFLWGITLYVE